VIGTLLLAVCLALAPPWRERRGRRPASATWVIAAIAVPAILVDVAVVIAKPESIGLLRALGWVAIMSAV